MSGGASTGGGGGGSGFTVVGTPQLNYTIIYDGTNPHWAAAGTSFSFSIASFTSNAGSSTQEIGSGTWKAIGALSFSASYNNGPATGGFVSHSGWTNLTLGGAGFTGPTVSTQSVSYPGSAGGTQSFTLNATNGSSSPTSTITITFVNHRFWGASTVASGFTESDIEALSDDELSNSKAKTFNVTTGSGEYILYSYPNRLGTATFSINGFAGGFIGPDTVSVTNGGGFTEDYYVYRSLLTDLGTVSVGVT